MATDPVYTTADLIAFQPKHRFFVGVDSDGCVFDTMEIKQKRCFHTVSVNLWHLEAIEAQAREALEFVNLYSKWRGQNRFIAQVIAFDLLRARPEIRKTGVTVPELKALKRFMESGRPLSNPEIAKAVAETGDAELAFALRWSQEVNALIARTVSHVPPFPHARASLERVAAQADVICVSQTPTEALVREWRENDLTRLVAIIAGQELGTKAEHIQLATRGKYDADKVLMIGDAPGDLKAAKANGAFFYPINPLDEAASWQRFHDEAFDRFIAGTYGGAYEQALIRDFDARLPEHPTWKT